MQISAQLNDAKSKTGPEAFEDHPLDPKSFKLKQ